MRGARFGFVMSTPGTCERGSAEYQRQRDMIEAAGGVLGYLQGARPRDKCPLTEAVNRGIMRDAEGHDNAPVSGA